MDEDLLSPLTLGPFRNVRDRHRMTDIYFYFSTLLILLPTVSGQIPTAPSPSTPSCTLTLSITNLITTIPWCRVKLGALTTDSSECQFEQSVQHRQEACTRITCQGWSVQVTPGWGKEHRELFKETIQMNCSSPNPLDFDVHQPIPFAGIGVTFGKYSDEDSSLLHWVGATLPQVVEVKDEGFEAFTGNYTFYSTENQAIPNATIDLTIIDALAFTHKLRSYNEICWEINDGHITCSVSSSMTDLYLANIGGENPTQTRLLEPCLNSSLENTCGNKFPGTNCRTQRYCKKIVAFHQNGLFRCSSDSRTEDLQYFKDINAEIQTNFSRIWENELVIRIEKEDGNPAKRLEIEGEEESDMDFHNNSATDSSQSDFFNGTTNVTSSQIMEQGCRKPTSYAVMYKLQEALAPFDQEPTALECHFLPYLLVPPVIWSISFVDGSTKDVFSDYGGNTTKENRFYGNMTGDVDMGNVDINSSHFRFNASLDMEQVSCRAAYWSSSKYASNTQNLSVQKSIAPSFSVRDLQHEETSDLLTLNCSVHNAQPPPTYTWEKDGQKLNSHSYHVKTGIYRDKVGKDDGGKYTCIAKNFLGEARQDFHVTVRKIGDKTWIWFTLVALVIIVVLLLVLFKLYTTYLAQKSRLTELEIKEFLEGNKKELKENYYAHENAQFMPYNKDYDVPWKEFQIEDDELGKGVHGIVYKGQMNKLPIAVKTLRPGVEKVVLKALLSELKVMIHLGKHEHIVELRGACTEFLSEGRAYVLVEYCPLGSVQSYLRKNRNCFWNGRTDVDYVNGVPGGFESAVDVQQFTINTLIQWGIQIARGMQHMEDKKVLHGDLATRNILLCSMDHIKITDFGLSRQLVNCDTYVKTQQEQLPWRWMAIESLRQFIFTSKSDVWMFGVTLWELFTLGQTPYPGLSWSPDFLQYLEDNLRLSRPKYANDATYKILTDCWAPAPESRPDFATLESRLLALLK